MKGNIVFNNKATSIDELDDFTVEMVVVFPHEQYRRFSENLLEDNDFIADVTSELGTDEFGRCRCLLVLDEEQDGGILVHSSGYTYARYSAYYPCAKTQLKDEIRDVADSIIKGRFGQSEKGTWIIGFDDIKEHFDLTVTPNNGIGTLLLEELESREEISEIVATEDCIQITSYLDQVPENTSPEEKMMTVFSLMGCGLEDVHLVDNDEEHDLATIVELNQDTLTEEGKRDWADVLGAKVERVFVGVYGLQVAVSGCDPQRLCDFSYMLAGYGSEKDYDRWVNTNDEQGETNEIQRI
jgi:hypothetical protein